MSDDVARLREALVRLTVEADTVAARDGTSLTFGLRRLVADARAVLREITGPEVQVEGINCFTHSVGGLRRFEICQTARPVDTTISRPCWCGAFWLRWL